MALKLKLKANEKIMVGGIAFQNGNKKTELSLLSDAVVLRGRDILTEESANSPALRIYYTVQLMYMAGGFMESSKHHDLYWSLVNDFAKACPNGYVAKLLGDISSSIMDEELYKALKLCKDLIQYEKGVFDYVFNDSSTGS